MDYLRYLIDGHPLICKTGGVVCIKVCNSRPNVFFVLRIVVIWLENKYSLGLLLEKDN
jgi:hypothetical protein